LRRKAIKKARKIKTVTGKVRFNISLSNTKELLIELHSGAGAVYLPKTGRTNKDLRLKDGDKVSVTIKVDKRAK